MKKRSFSKAATAFFLAALIAVSSVVGFASKASAAAISNGMAASYVIGQQDFESKANDYAANRLDTPQGVVVDEAHDRLFVADGTNNRVMVYDISGGVSTDMNASWVIGQDTLTSTSVSLDAASFTPSALAYDADRNWLYVADDRYNRVLVFDVATITNGEDAIYVLGQATFDEGNTNANQGQINAIGMVAPKALAYDSLRKILFVADSNLRVIGFDVATITNGEDAVYLLGQPDFQTGNSAWELTARGMQYPYGLAYDIYTKRLFVAEAYRRVTVFDLATITNSEPAIAVLGQDDLESNQQATTRDGMYAPDGIFYDAYNKRLYVTDPENHRALMYDLSSGVTNGMNAANVLGQPDFTTGIANSTGTLVQDPKGDYYLTCDTCMGSPNAVAVSPANQQVYVVDQGNNRVLVFNIDNTNNGGYPAYITYTGGTFEEAGANDGTVTGSLVATLANDTFVNAGSTLVRNTHYSVTNAPAGLTPVVTVNNGGTTATLTFTGSASAHANANDVANVTLSFLNGALTNTANLSGVSGTSYTTASVDFDDPAPSNNNGGTTNQNTQDTGPRPGSIMGGMAFGSSYGGSVITIPVTPSGATYVTLRRGSRGEAVKTLQTLLNARGASPVLAVDGSFGGGTLKAVLAFQKAKLLGADGIVGRKTWTELYK